MWLFVFVRTTGKLHPRHDRQPSTVFSRRALEWCRMPQQKNLANSLPLSTERKSVYCLRNSFQITTELHIFRLYFYQATMITLRKISEWIFILQNICDEWSGNRTWFRPLDVVFSQACYKKNIRITYAAFVVVYFRNTKKLWNVEALLFDCYIGLAPNIVINELGYITSVTGL